MPDWEKLKNYKPVKGPQPLSPPPAPPPPLSLTEEGRREVVARAGLATQFGDATRTQAELRAKKRRQMQLAGFTPEAIEKEIATLFPAPAVVGGFSGATLPYKGGLFDVDPAPPQNVAIPGGMGLTDALRPQRRQLDLVGAFAPGAGATDAQIQESRAEAERRREALRREVDEKGRLAMIDAIPRANFGVPRELIATSGGTPRPVSEKEKEAFVQSQYPSGQEVGQLVENPLSYAGRIISSIDNALAGAIGYAITPDSIQERKEAGRTGALKGTTGLKGNIIANLADTGGGGFMKEFGEIAKYSRGGQDYETPLALLGLGLDILGTGGVAGVGKIAKGVTRGFEGLKAGEGALKAAAAGSRVAAAGLAETIPFGVGKTIGAKVRPNDVRTVVGAKVADGLNKEVEALNEYERIYKGAAAAEGEGELIEGAISNSDAERLTSAFNEIENLTTLSFVKRLLEDGKRETDQLMKVVAKIKTSIKGTDKKSNEARQVLEEITEKLYEKIIDEGSIFADDLLDEFTSNPKIGSMDSSMRLKDPAVVAKVAADAAKEFVKQKFPDTNISKRAVANEDIDVAALFEDVKKGLTEGTKKEFDNLRLLTNNINSGNKKLTLPEKELLRRNVDALKRFIPGGSSPGTRVGEGSPAEKLFEAITVDPETKQKAIEAITRDTLFDIGVGVVDAKTVGKVGGVGDTYEFITKNTIATPQAAKEVRNKFRSTPLGGSLGSLKAEGAGLGYPLFKGSPEFEIEIVRAAERARAKGVITADELDEYFNKGIVANGVPADEFEKVVASELDDIARASRKGIVAGQLSPVRTPEASAIGQEAEREFIAKGKRFEELTKNSSIVMGRVVDSMSKKLGVGTISSAMTETQKSAMQRARNSIGTLDKQFRQELIRLQIPGESGDRIRDIYELKGVENPSDIQILFTLGRGLPTYIGSTPGPFVRRQHAEALVKSMLFSRNTGDFSMAAAFSPSYRSGADAIESAGAKQKIDELIKKITDAKMDNIENVLLDVAKDLQKIAKDYPDLIRLASKGSQFAIAATPEAIKTSLISAYAFRKADEIAKNAILEASRQVPGIFEEQQRFFQTVFPLEVDRSINEFMYSIIKAEIGAEIAGKVGPIAMARRWDRPPIISARLEIYTDKVMDARAQSKAIPLIAKSKLPPEMAQIGEAVDSTVVEPLFKERAAELFKNMLVSDKGADLLDALSNALDAVRVSGAYENKDLELTLQSIDLLNKYKIPFGKFVSPALAKQFMDEIGGAPKIDELKLELAKLADVANSGNANAIGASRFIRKMMDYYNSFFYYSILSINPIFHGRNIVTAPLIIPYTTGQSLFKYDSVKSLADSFKVLNHGRPNAKPVMNAQVLFSDPNGIPYTSKRIYDLAIGSGIFKSQLGSEVNRRFTDDITEMLKGAPSIRQKIFTSPSAYLGTPLAEYSDSVFRLTVLMNALKEGKPVAEALDLGRRSLFDYGEITDTERKYVARYGFVFYNYFRQSVTQFMKNLFTNPSRVIKELRLAKGVSNYAVGDQNADDLSFYYPEEFGTTKAVINLKKSYSKETGNIAVLPEMPIGDGLGILTSLILSPINFFTGPELVGGGTAYEEGFPFNKLGPLTKSLLELRLSKKDWADQVKITKNRIPLQHMALFNSNPLTQSIVNNLFNVQEIDAKPDERGLNGKVYFVNDDDFERYKNFMAFVQTTGAARPINEWGNNLGLISGTISEAQEKEFYDKLLTRSGIVSMSGPVTEQERVKALLKTQQKEMEKQIRGVEGEIKSTIEVERGRRKPGD